jgi:predicted  nucleic acid-binding Zn-ribbon protein
LKPRREIQRARSELLKWTQHISDLAEHLAEEHEHANDGMRRQVEHLQQHVQLLTDALKASEARARTLEQKMLALEAHTSPPPAVDSFEPSLADLPATKVNGTHL